MGEFTTVGLEEVAQKFLKMESAAVKAVPLMLAAGADVIVQAQQEEAEAMGIKETAGHYGIEKLFIPYMEDYLKQNLPGIELHTAPFREPFTVC